MTETALRGAGRCPRCHSRRVKRATIPKTPGFYSPTLEACLNPACNAVWEPFDPGDLLDAGDITSSFREPCDNCAFRPGSPEQADPQRWAELMNALKHQNGRFYCHKGVPIEPASDHGFDYPRDRDGKIAPAKLRLCRGWLRMWAAKLDKTEGQPP